MEEQTIPIENMNEQANLDWLAQEQAELDQNRAEHTTPALTLEEGKITTFEVDFSKPFEKWIEPETGVVKKIIPVKYNGEERVLWLNTRNPLYSQIITAGTNGQFIFKVMRTGVKNQTRYALVKE